MDPNPQLDAALSQDERDEIERRLAEANAAAALKGLAAGVDVLKGRTADRIVIVRLRTALANLLELLEEQADEWAIAPDGWEAAMYQRYSEARAALAETEAT